jgi:zinc transport system substrate-binding protein
MIRKIVMQTICRLLVFFWVLFWGSSGFAAEPVPVFVSILPQKYFVEKIGGDQVRVSVMVQPGASPHNYEPKPRQMSDLAQAKIYFAVGVPFEKAWLEKITGASPGIRVIHTDEGIEKMAMEAHTHNEEGHEEHKGHDVIKDPHVWLSPPLVIPLARNITKGLCSIDPDHCTVYENNCGQFIHEIESLDADIRHIFADITKGRRFMVFHPSWGYFAQAYGLEQIPIEIEGKSPRPADLQKLIVQAREEKVKAVFVQPQFSQKTADVIASAAGARIIPADPLAENWAENLRDVSKKLGEAVW